MSEKRNGSNGRTARRNDEGDLNTVGKAPSTSGAKEKTLFPLFAKKGTGSASKLKNGNDPTVQVYESSAQLPERHAQVPNASSSSRVHSNPPQEPPPPGLLPNGNGSTKHDRTAFKSQQSNSMPNSVGLPYTSEKHEIEKLPKTPPKVPGQDIIEISDSPLKDTPPLKTFDQFRAERDAKRAVKRAAGWDGGKEPLWPGRENLHVVPLGALSKPPDMPQPTAHPSWKGKERALCLEDSQPALSSYADYCHDRQERLSITRRDEAAIPLYTDDKYHPLLSRLSLDVHSPSELASSSSSLWTTSYGPACAEEVLGTESQDSALVLRDWLKELSLQESFTPSPRVGSASPSKRKIKREVSTKEKKRHKRDEKRSRRKHGRFRSDDEEDLADFVAADDEEESEYYDYYDLPDEMSIPSPEKTQISAVSAPRFSPLTNLILLTGPIASGKTSAVYSVAKELDWQVFEVYPGIGKRGAKDLDRYVGMVGQHHIIQGEGPVRPIADIFNQSKRSEEVEARQEGAATTSKVKQSLILVEEVDVLYASDQGFWDGLVSLVAKSRRPVILTCNDPSVIPFASLPLQTTLQFARPADIVSHAFLGRVVDLDYGKKWSPGSEAVPRSACSRKKLDLRHCLLMMQLGDAGVKPTLHDKTHRSTGEHDAVDLRSCVVYAENTSYVDAEVSRKESLEMADTEDIPSIEDDFLVGHPEKPFHHIELVNTIRADVPLPCYARDTEFAEALLGWDAPDVSMPERMEYADSVRAIAESQLDTFYVLPSALHFYTDYLPFLREIVLADDTHERFYNEAMMLDQEDAVIDSRIRRSRRLAGTTKEKYRRYGEMPGQVVQVIRRSGVPLA